VYRISHGGNMRHIHCSSEYFLNALVYEWGGRIFLKPLGDFAVEVFKILHSLQMYPSTCLLFILRPLKSLLITNCYQCYVSNVNWAGWFGDRIPEGARFSVPVQRGNGPTQPRI
jgi:hypothetical protein